MFHVESAFEFYKWTTLNIYIFTNFITIFMANIFFKSFCHVNKQCLLLHEKIRRSKAHDKKKIFAIHNEKHCDFDTLRLRRMENV